MLWHAGHPIPCLCGCLQAQRLLTRAHLGKSQELVEGTSKDTPAPLSCFPTILIQTLLKPTRGGAGYPALRGRSKSLKQPLIRPVSAF